MTSAIETDWYFENLVELLAHEYVTAADNQRIGRLAEVVAARRGVSVQTILDAALFAVDVPA